MAPHCSTRLGWVLLLISFALGTVAGASYRTRPQPTAVLQGQTVTLTCAFDGLADDDTVIWEGGPDDKTIAFGRNVLKVYRRHRITGDASRGEYNLEIMGVKLEDDGKYSCYTDPKSAADAILTVVVPMTGPPAVKGGELPVTSGDLLSLTCRASGGHPAPRITWLNGTHRFRDASVSNEDQSLELFLPRVTKWDHGANFTCRADQGFPQLARPKASSRILRVKYPPAVSVPSPSVHVREGEPASLSCMVDSNPKATVTWRKVGGAIPILNMMRDHVLHLPKVSRHDGGLYHCDANNGVLPKGTGTVTLQVYYPPVIEATMEDQVTMLYGQDDQSLRCLADGNPKPHIRWRRKDTSLYWDNPLRFHRVRYDVQGTYQCVAASDGFQEVTKDVYVDVVGKPSIQRGQPAVTVASGNTARFHCEILADPLPGRVSWFRQSMRRRGEETVVMATEVGVSITENPVDDGTSSTLLLKDVGKSQEGTYICQAANMFGEARREIRLQVFDNSGSLVIICVSMATAGLGILAGILVCVAVKKRWICREKKRAPPPLLSARSLAAVPSGRSVSAVPKPGKRLGHGTNDSGVEDLELQELDGTLKPRPPPRGDKQWTNVGLSYSELAHAHATTLPPYTTVERHRPDGEDIRACAREGIPEEAIVPDAACLPMGVPTPPPKAAKGKRHVRAPSGETPGHASVREAPCLLTESQADSI
ncbi:irregular chiasm C-roughest protein-like [Branchiostoma floridae x Branchiostoma belcheri]